MVLTPISIIDYDLLHRMLDTSTLRFLILRHLVPTGAYHRTGASGPACRFSRTISSKMNYINWRIALSNILDPAPLGRLGPYGRRWSYFYAPLLRANFTNFVLGWLHWCGSTFSIPGKIDSLYSEMHSDDINLMQLWKGERWEIGWKTTIRVAGSRFDWKVLFTLIFDLCRNGLAVVLYRRVPSRQARLSWTKTGRGQTNSFYRAISAGNVGRLDMHVWDLQRRS